MYSEGQDSSIFGVIPFSKIVGTILILLGLVVFSWVLWEAYFLFNQGSAFKLFDDLLPQEILVADFPAEGRLLLPRELLVYGVPLSILSLAVNMGGLLLKYGFQYIEKPGKV